MEKNCDMQLNDSTLEETVWRITPGMPYSAFICNLNHHEHGVPWHWHGEVEAFYMRSGAMEYSVPGRTMVFEEGEAGFVNANVLHSTRALGEGPTLQEEHQFLPSFISNAPGSDIESKYVRPILRKNSLDIVKFPAESEAVGLMQRANEIFQKAETGFELRVRALMSELWLIVVDLAKGIPDSGAVGNPDDQRLKQMLNYILEHFSERITQEDIANSGFVGERECYRIFRRNLNTTPGSYLLECRLNHACEMLRTTDMPILDVALSCGFCSGSYFGKIFRQNIGKTPREYRAGV